MNNAEKVKQLAEDYATAFSDFSLFGGPKDYKNRAKSEEALHAAIDEMQEEIDLLRGLLTEVEEVKRHPDHDWPFSLSLEVAQALRKGKGT